MVKQYNPFRAEIVQNRFEFQDHVEGKIGIHDGYDIVLDPSITINSVNCTNAYQATEVLSNYIQNISENLPIATNSVTGAVRLGDNIFGSSNISGFGGRYDNIRVVRITNNNIPISVNNNNNKGDILRIIDGVLVASANLPEGTAGGNLSGTYPNPSVVNVTIPDQLQGDILTYDGYNWGLVNTSFVPSGTILRMGTGINKMPGWYTPTFFSPEGFAGGVLQGEYPNPTVKINSVSMSSLSLNTNSFAGYIGNPTNQSLTYGQGLYHDGYSSMIYPSKSRFFGFEEHFVTSIPISMNSFTYGSGVTVSSGNANVSCMGVHVININTSNIGSGGGYRTTQKIRLTGNQKFVSRMFIYQSSTGVSTYFGFFSSDDIPSSPQGLYFRINSSGVRAVAHTGSSESLGANFTLSTQTVYRFVIEVMLDGSRLGRMFIYNDDGQQLYFHQFPAVTLPSDSTLFYCGINTIRTSNNAVTLHPRCDYLSYHDYL